MGPPADIDWNQPWHTISRGIPCFRPSHLFAAIRFSKCGQRNIYPNIGHLQITLLYLMTVAGRNASCIGTQEVEGVFEWQIQIQDLCAGITWAPGLILPATPITGSSTRPTSFPLSRHDVVFTFSNIVCTYNVLRFTSCALNGPPLGIQDQSKNFHNITRLSFLRVYPFFSLILGFLCRLQVDRCVIISVLHHTRV